MPNPKPHPSHKFTDVSYHGSPDWECEYCDLSDYHPDIALPCKKATECLARKEEAKEEAEHYEYLAMKAQHERFEYLKKKFESGKRRVPKKGGT